LLSTAEQQLGDHEGLEVGGGERQALLNDIGREFFLGQLSKAAPQLADHASSDVVVLEPNCVLDDVIAEGVSDKRGSRFDYGVDNGCLLVQVSCVDAALNYTTPVSMGGNDFAPLGNGAVDEKLFVVAQHRQTLLDDVVPVEIGREHDDGIVEH